MTRQPSRHDFRYVTTDIPEDMTIAEWRHQRATVAEPRQTAVQRAIALVGRAVRARVQRGGGARSGLAAKHGVLRVRQALPFGSLRES